MVGLAVAIAGVGKQTTEEEGPENEMRRTIRA